MNKKIILEVCANSIDSALAAQNGGASRVELCSNLNEGGTTPSQATIEITRKLLTIQLNVLIRPRGGDFLYNDHEFEIMKRDIEVCKTLGVDGVVIGILDEEGNIDFLRTQKLIEIARPMSVTFHRAFDMARDPLKSLSVLMNLGVDRLLTSGQQEKAFLGLTLIKSLINQAGNSLCVMPGSGISSDNIVEIATTVNAKEYHMTGKKGIKSLMKYINPQVSLGGDPNVHEYLTWITDSGEIRKVVTLLDNLTSLNKLYSE